MVMKKSVMVFFIVLGIAFIVTIYMEDYKEVRVTEVIDGDTIKVGYKSVRLIGINAPETNEPCYEEAKEMLKELVEHKKVRMEKDVEDRDDYGRLLRYVYVDEQIAPRLSTLPLSAYSLTASWSILISSRHVPMMDMSARAMDATQSLGQPAILNLNL